MNALTRMNEEQRLEALADERQHASYDVLVAAWDANVLTDDDRELGEVQLGRVAYFLAEGMKKRAGAWPTPEVAKLQRAWDALCRLDEDASEADRCAIHDVLEVES